SQTDTMEHEPCGLLRDSQCAVNLPRGNSILAIANHPHDRKPLLKAKRRIFEDCACLDTELRFRVPGLALPETTRRDECNVCPSACWADHSARPATSYKVIEAIVGITEKPNRFRKSLGVVCHA